MSNYVERAKEVIKQEIRQHPPGALINIPIESIEENVTAFQQAIDAPDIQRMLLQQDKRAQLQLSPRIADQAKKHILKYIRGAASSIEHIVVQCERRDFDEFLIALQSLEVQSELQRRHLTAELLAVSKDGKPLPDIIVATVDDAANGKLDEYLRQFE